MNRLATQRPDKERLQFGLRTLIGLVTICCVLFALIRLDGPLALVPLAIAVVSGSAAILLAAWPTIWNAVSALRGVKCRFSLRTLLLLVPVLGLGLSWLGREGRERLTVDRLIAIGAEVSYFPSGSSTAIIYIDDQRTIDANALALVEDLQSVYLIQLVGVQLREQDFARLRRIDAAVAYDRSFPP